MTGSVLGLVAAAGASTRMGFPKALLAPAGGAPLALHLANQLRSGGVDQVVCTLPPEDLVPPEYLPHLLELVRCLEAASVLALPNAAWSAGLLGSVRTALQRAGNARALVMTPVDAPGTDARLVRALLEAQAQRPQETLFPRVEGRPGHPVVLPSSAFARIQAYRGDGGVRDALDLRDAPGLAWRDPRCCANVDTPERAQAWDPPLNCWSPGPGSPRGPVSVPA